MPEVLVLGIVGLAVDAQGHVVCLGIVDLLVTGLDAPLTPGGDDRHVRGEVLDRQLEPDLVVALAGAAVDDGVGALLQGDLHKTLGDAGARVAGAEQIILINGARLHAGDDIVIHIFIRQIEHVQLGRAGLQSLLLEAFQLVRLADVAGYRDNLTVVVILLQPGDDDGSIQAAGIRQNDFFDVRFVHDSFLRMNYTPFFLFIHLIFINMCIYASLNEYLCMNYKQNTAPCQGFFHFLSFYTTGGGLVPRTCGK